MAVIMLFSRNAYVFRQYQQCRLLLANTLHTPECNSYGKDRHKYEYKQTRNFKNFGHTRKKSSFISALPIAIPSIGLFICMSIDWQR